MLACCCRGQSTRFASARRHGLSDAPAHTVGEKLSRGRNGAPPTPRLYTPSPPTNPTRSRRALAILLEILHQGEAGA